MNAETLKDFLISLGFNVDEAGARKFDSVVTGTTLKAIELGTKSGTGRCIGRGVHGKNRQ